MQQSRVEPYIGTSNSLRAPPTDVAPMPLFDPKQDQCRDDQCKDDQYTVAIPNSERTIDIPINGEEFEPTLTYDTHDIPTNRTAAEVQVGATLRKRYVLHRLIGTGGTCRVFLAEDLHRRLPPEVGGELVAVKVLRSGAGQRAASLQRLRREFLQMQQLTHGSIARVFDLDCDGELWFMTMELVDAPSALTWMNGDYSNAEALRVVLACCDAMDHAHRKGIVHGDLKPGNVMVLGDARVKLIDFGSSVGYSEDSETAKLEATPQYASPAVLAGNMAEVRDDVFSLGCLAYMILARGRHPFDRRPSSEAADAQLRAPLIPGIPMRMFEVVARALAWDPAERHGSVRELQHALLASELTRVPQPVPHRSMEGATTAVMPRPQDTVVMQGPQDTLVMPRPQETAAMHRPQDTLVMPRPQETAAMHRPQDTLVMPRPQETAAMPRPQETAAMHRPQDTLVPSRKERPAGTPGDYSYLDQFRGYVAGPKLDVKLQRDALEKELHELESLLLPKAPAPAVFVPEPSHVPTIPPATAQREPRVEHRPPHRPSRSKRTLVSAFGISLLVAAGFGAARLSGPAPKQELSAVVTPSVSAAPLSLPPAPPLVLALATPELKPMSLPRQRAPVVRIAAGKPVKPEQPKSARRGPEPTPAAVTTTRSASGARVSFQSRSVEVSPNQTLVAIPIRRSNSDRAAARVAWQIEGGRGPELLDAERAGAQVIQFHAGQAERTLYVPLRKEAGELAADGVRSFRVKLRRVADGPSPGRVAEVRVTLLD